MPRVVIIDDHAAFRSSARSLLELDGFDVVGEAADGASGLAVVDEAGADLVLVDVGLPDASGFDVAERIALATPPPDVILLSSRDQVELRGRVERSPARGFISKDALSGAAIAAVLGR